MEDDMFQRVRRSAAPVFDATPTVGGCS
jgi:hypothetical protein